MAERTVVCAHCETPFAARRSDARFCNQNCSAAARKGVLFARTCADCSTNISARHGNASLCAPCAETRAGAHGLHERVCPECGNPFMSKARQVHCSARCGGIAGRRLQVLAMSDQECPACARTFTPRGNRATACCNPCSQWLRRHSGELRRTSGECLTCGAAYDGEHAAQRFCSTKCSAAAGKVRRRGLMAAAYVEDVHLAEVAARCKWMCELCGLAVPRGIATRHPMSPSIDHVVPISRGGAHSYANTQLAHLVCNIRKGNKLIT